ncbi:MAG: hypothetical protein MRERC_6c017 [Mycoplasmataceae bacterium RC_NB112A]|nr:MAG: hypothetical protein MRERC_13c017 [Mycoplasmataceae bacterium RC_NB112A]KLL01936.1 MAG: hypothetical protein MRERC_6c017 [Mycoplasmataceae bacterium RC_NB112A]
MPSNPPTKNEQGNQEGKTNNSQNFPLNNQSKSTPNTQSIASSASDDTKVNAKQQINQLLKHHNLKTSDLPQKYQNWEKDLEKLETKEKIKNFIQELDQAIQQQIDQREQRSTTNPNQNKNTLSLSTKIFLGIGISVLAVGLLLLVIRNLRMRKKNK